MELEELKQIWKKQNSLLEKSLTLSEQMAKNTFAQKANGELESLLRWNYFSLVEFIVFLIFILVCTYSFMDDWRFLIPGNFLIVFLTLCIISSVKSIKQLNAMNLYSCSVVDTKRSLLKYKQQSNREMKILLFVIPPIIPAFTLLGARFIRDINLFDYTDFFIMLSAGSILLSYTLAFISYRTICLRRFRIIENNLVELEKFKEE